MKSSTDVQFVAAAFKIRRWLRLISCQNGGLPNGSPKLSMTSVLAEAFRAVGRLFDMKAIWSEMAENLSVAPIRNYGHLPQEEQPEVVNKLLLDFLRGWNG